MILHCTPPYRYNTPNAALGYLKGFLQAEGIPVTNVYWNVILLKVIRDFKTVLANYSGYVRPFPDESITFYICKKLLNLPYSSQTTADQIFSSMYTKEELAEVIHAVREDIDTYIDQNNLSSSPLSGFTVKTYQWLMGSYIMNRLKEINPQMKIVIGGIYNEEQAHTFMKVFPQVDYAVWGEGEYPLLYLAQAVEHETVDEKTETIPHLVYRQGNHVVTSQAPEQHYPPLDEYPFADHSDYFALMKKVDPFDRSSKIPVWGSRSCYWNKCNFCALNEGYIYRARSPHNIVKEMEYQSKKYRIDEFFFADSDIAGNKKRFMTLINVLMESIRKRRRPYRIVTEISPLFIDAETAPLMKRAGFYKVQAGFEAISESLLKKMRKRQSLVYNIQAIKMASQNNIPLSNINIIRGIPTETVEDIKETCENLWFLRFFIHNARPLPINFFLLDRSPFYNEMSEAERETWKVNMHWDEVVPLNMIPEADRFKFFLFYQNGFKNYHQWDTFSNLLSFCSDMENTYEWIETPAGSLVTEKGREPISKSVVHHLNHDETDILVFCDTVKTFAEVQEKFSHIREDELRSILYRLKDAALLYVDAEGTSISIVDAARKHLPE